jgi:predicted peroxiredoxin
MEMNRLRTIVVAVLVLAAAVAIAGTRAAANDAPEKSTLFVSITSGDLWECQMALGYASRVHDMGYDVVIFLNVRGIRLANKNLPQPTMATLKKTPTEMLTTLMESGVDVYVCPMCMEYAGMTVDDFIAGAKQAGPEMVAIQMDPTTKVMSY